MNIKLIPLCVITLMLAATNFFACGQDTTFVYQKPLFDFSYEKPPFKLSEEQQANKTGFLRASVLTGYREGVAPIKGFVNFQGFDDEKSGTRKLSFYNESIVGLLTFGAIPPQQVVLEVKDLARYRYDPSLGSKEAWIRKNGYCFELILPVSVIKGANVIRKELESVFGVEAGRKKRMLDVLVLVRTSKTDKLASKGQGKPAYDMNGNFNNIQLADGRFGHALYDAGVRVVDETNYTGAVDMKLDITDWTDLAAVRKALRRYDLDLKEEKRELEVFVITEMRNK